jgi:hypothetical protein
MSIRFWLKNRVWHLRFLGSAHRGWMSYLKFSFRNVNCFPKEIQKLLKDFIYFYLKWFLFEFILNLNRVYKVKIFIWYSKFIYLDCEYFQTIYLFWILSKSFKKIYALCWSSKLFFNLFKSFWFKFGVLNQIPSLYYVKCFKPWFGISKSFLNFSSNCASKSFE